MALNLGAPTPVTLPSGQGDAVPTCRVQFDAWGGDPSLAPRYNANPKAVVSVHGVPMFPELAVLRKLEALGWSGVWIDNFGRGRLIREWGVRPVLVELEERNSRILARIPLKSGRWDIFAWRGDDILFAELKGGKDRIRPSQRQWLEAALNAGFDLSQFALVEWTISPAGAEPN